MAHHCTIDTLYGAIQAKAAVDDGPLFNNEHINNAGFESQLNFAKKMNDLANKQAGSNGNVNISDYVKNDHNLLSEVPDVINRGINLARTPEALIPKKIFSKIDKRMSQWDNYYRKNFAPKLKAINDKYSKLATNIKDKKQLKALEQKRQNELAPIVKDAKASYRQSLANQFNESRKQLQAVFNEYADKPEKLDKELKKLGMTKEDAYYTNKYLEYLGNGGPFFNLNPGGGNKVAGWIQERVSAVTGNKVSWNPMTALYNVGEAAQKGPAAFGFRNTINGIMDAHKAANQAKVTLLDQIPALAKSGVYDNDYTPLRPGGKNDPVTRSQNLLDNLGYFIGKRGGDAQKGLKEISYRPKPWNDTFVYQDPLSKSLISFMSFQFRHMQQYGGWFKTALSKDSSTADRIKATKALAAYSLMTGLIYGDRAAIPAPVYGLIQAVDPNIDQDIKDFQKQFGLAGEVLNRGLVGLATGGNVDLTNYARPFGGVSVGVGTDIVNTAADTLGNKLPKAIKETKKGRLDKGAALLLSGLVTTSQLFKHGANALTQKVIDAVTKSYINDENLQGYLTNTGQKIFGPQAVKKAAQ